MKFNRNIILIIALNLIVFAISSEASEHHFTFESAAGFGSSRTPFSPDWRGNVAADGVFYREFAIRGTYEVNNYLSARISTGWIKELGESTSHIDISDLSYGSYPYRQSQRIAYVIPSMRFSSTMIRLDFGGIIYKAYYNDNKRYGFAYPFDRSHRFRPSMGIELGENTLFLYGGIANSFPFHSGGDVVDMGFGGRVGRIYEHKIYLSSNAITIASLGYRGEARIFKNMAISFGAKIGPDNHGILLSATAGIKTIF